MSHHVPLHHTHPGCLGWGWGVYHTKFLRLFRIYEAHVTSLCHGLSPTVAISLHWTPHSVPEALSQHPPLAHLHISCAL